MTKNLKIELKPILIMALALTSLIAACGSQSKFKLSRTSAQFEDIGTSKTGATATDGKPYTSYSQPAEVLQVKESVPDNDDNKKFGAQIEKASVIYRDMTSTNPLVVATNTVEVQVKWQGLTNALTFQGQLSTNGKSFVARMTDATNQRPDLTMNATCTDVACYHGQFKIDDGQGHSVGIIINKENRTLRLKIPADPQAAGYAPNPFADQFKTGKPVTVTTTEIYPGKAYYEIEEITANKETPGLKLSGDLEEPEGDSIPVQMNDATQQDKSKASLIGNDEEGNLLFKFTPLDDGSATPDDQASAGNSAGNSPDQPATVPPPAKAPATAPTGNGRRPTTPVTPPTTVPAPLPSAPAAEPPTQGRRRRAPAVYLELTDATPETNVAPTNPSAAPNAPSVPANPRKKIPPTPAAAVIPTRHAAPSTNSGDNGTSPYTVNDCPIQMPQGAAAMIEQIMKDCGNSEVERYIHGSWASSKKAARRTDPQPRLLQTQRFLYYNELRQQPNPKADSRDKRAAETLTRVAQLKTVISILDSEQFPEIWSLVTVQETGFNNLARGGDGELGLWQMMVGTAQTYGLPAGQRQNVSLETKAALKYYRVLLDKWDGDVKMALAEYNRGSSLEGSSKELEKDIKRGKVEIPDLAEAYAVSRNFWYIYKNHMIHQRKGHWDYVPSVLAAMFTAMAPQAYGVESVQAMEPK